MAQPSQADSPVAMTVTGDAQNSAIPQAGTGNSSAVTPVGTVAAAMAGTHLVAVSPVDPGNPQPDLAPPPANADSPVPVPTLPSGNDIGAASAPQNQPHDARSDAVAPPLYPAGAASPAPPAGGAIAPPSGPAAPPISTAAEQVAMHVAQSLNEGGKTVTIELHPAELGRVEIHFSFHSDGMDVRMTVDRQETFDALSHDRNGLHQQLAQAGVDLGGGGLDVRLGQQQPDQPGGYSSGRTPRAAMPTPSPQSTPATLWVSNSLLDILA
jgi:flagellar hook-length control protein FliK